MLVVPHVKNPFAEEEKISSTAIRHMIVNKEFDKAAVCLSRPFFVMGRKEEHVTLSKNNNHMFNISMCAPLDKLLPPVGAYVTKLTFGQITHESITHIIKKTHPIKLKSQMKILKTFFVVTEKIDKPTLISKTLNEMIQVEFLKEIPS